MSEGHVLEDIKITRIMLTDEPVHPSYGVTIVDDGES